MSDFSQSPFFPATSLLYHIRFSLSRGFSKVFWTFFLSLSGFAFVITAVLPGDLFIISLPVPFVKRFFELFSSFFVPSLPDPSATPSRWQPRYYITSPTPCQYLFRTFLCFLRFFRNSFFSPCILNFPPFYIIIRPYFYFGISRTRGVILNV